jgi:ATP-dependent DNA helicase RecG
MTQQELILLVDRLRSDRGEKEWFEFKRNRCAPMELGEYLSALSNSAAWKNESMGYLIFGVGNDTHDIISTSFDPYNSKAKGNQDLLIWLNTSLNPNPGFDVEVVEHPQGRLVVFSVRPARGQPVYFLDKAFIRVGSSKTELRHNAEALRAIVTSGSDWSSQICDRATINDLDPDAIAKAREEFKVKYPDKASVVDSWSDTVFLNKAKLTIRGAVTNAALLLLGRDESSALLSPAVAKISWILKDGKNRELDYEHFGPPFFLQVDRVLQKIRNLTLRAMPSGTLFPREFTQYDLWVLREALHNCIAHQDYGLHGRINVVETPDAVLLTNSGDFLPGDVETIIRQDAPQTIYRNPFLAAAMVNLNMIDTQGGGIKKMYVLQAERFFPLPDYDLTDPARVAVTLRGEILDESYCRLLMKRTDLDLEEIILLDKVQKKIRISREDHKRLKKESLIEGRYPNLFVAGEVAKTTGGAGRHIRERGFDKRYYLDLIMELVREHEPVGRSDVDDVLLRKLPDHLTPEQKKRKVKNLLQELRRSGRIANSGSRTSPVWSLSRDSQD